MANAIRIVDVQGLRQYMEQHRESDYLLVDVRQPDEYLGGHIPGSVLLPLGELPARLDELPLDRDVVFYCRSGKRSMAAAVLFADHPRTGGEVYNVAGGMLAWNGEVLSPAPNLRVFDLSGDRLDLLLRAMDLERGAERFYHAIGERFGVAPWGMRLRELAQAEEAHARMIYCLWAEGQAEPPAFAEVYGRLAGDLVEGGLAYAELMTLLAAQPISACRAGVEMALAIEYAAYDLSRNMAHHFRDQPMAATFTTIAEAERLHMRQVAEVLALCRD